MRDGAFAASVRARLVALPVRGSFEAHLTVAAEAAAFGAHCAAHGVPCVIIELARGAQRSQPMTASHHHGDLAGVLAEIEAVHDQLVRAGFPVIRVKLEALATTDGIPVAGGYFEFHAKLRLDGDPAALEALAMRHRAHLSRSERSAGERFVTLRVYDASRATAMAAFDALLGELAAAGYELAGERREYTIYDSREELDAGWLP